MKSPMPKFVVLFPVLALLAVVGCGSDGDTSAPAGVPSGPAGAPTEEVEAANEEAAPESECSLPDGLLEQLNLDRQLVLAMAQSGGGNLDDADDAFGLPEPATFRSVADILDELDLAGVEPLPSFDGSDDVIQDLRQTADLVAAVLAAESASDPAWAALGEFYTQELFVRNNASIGYYLDEAGCM